MGKTIEKALSLVLTAALLCNQLPLLPASAAEEEMLLAVNSNVVIDTLLSASDFSTISSTYGENTGTITFDTSANSIALNQEESDATLMGYDEAGLGIIDPRSILPTLEPTLSEDGLFAISRPTTVTDYQVGDTTYISNMSGSSSGGTGLFELLYVGDHCNVWVLTTEEDYYKLTSDEAQTLGEEYDRIYPLMYDYFGSPLVLDEIVDNDDRTNLLCYDISADGDSSSSSYIAGYFWSSDAYPIYMGGNGNTIDAVHLDTAQGMDASSTKTKDVTSCYATMVHELQHLIASGYIGVYTDFPVFLNEAFSESASHLIYGSSACSSRVSYYNISPTITSGQSSLTLWNYISGYTYYSLDNYSLSYLFGQYIRTQSSSSIYKELMTLVGDSTSLTAQECFHLLADLLGYEEDSDLIADFYTALYRKQSGGPYGFGGESWADAIQVKTVSSTTTLFPGAAVYYNQSGTFVPSTSAGENIQFISMTEDAILTGITVDTPPTTTNYVAYQTFDPTDMVVSAQYDDGTSLPLSQGDYTISYPSSDSYLLAGDSLVTLSYAGQTATVSISVERATLDTSAITWTSNTSLPYTDGFQQVSLVNLSELVSVSYENQSQCYVGTYTATATLTPLDEDNYVVSNQPDPLEWHITPLSTTLTSIYSAESPYDLCVGTSVELGTLISCSPQSDLTFAVDSAYLSLQEGVATAGDIPSDSVIAITVSAAGYDVDGEGDLEYAPATTTLYLQVTAKEIATFPLTQEGADYLAPLPDPVYSTPQDGGEMTLSYSGTQADGTPYLSNLAPTQAGDYTVTASCQSADTVYTASAPFSIYPIAPQLSDLVITLPQDCSVGALSPATATAGDTVVGLGEITLSYVLAEGDTPSTELPTEGGVYALVCDIASGTNYTAASLRTQETFTLSNVMAPTVAVTSNDSLRNNGLYAVDDPQAVDDNQNTFTVQLTATAQLGSYERDDVEGEWISLLLGATKNGTPLTESQLYWSTDGDLWNSAADAVLSSMEDGGDGVTQFTFWMDATDTTCYLSTDEAGSDLVTLLFSVLPYEEEEESSSSSSSGSSGSSSSSSSSSGISYTTVTTTTTTSETTEVATFPFTDVDTDFWGYAPIVYAYENGLFSGVDETTFAPNTTMTRGMIVSVLHRLAGSPSADLSTFSDVADGAWYAEAIAWAAENAIVSGYPDGTFAPEEAITRQQAAVIFVGYATAMGITLPQTAEAIQFTDSGDIGDWAASAVETAQRAGIISGKVDSSFDPLGTATRAEVCSMLYILATL